MSTTTPFYRRYRRWSSGQTRWGLFTHARDTHDKPISIVLDSGGDEFPGCHLRLRGFGHTVIVELPGLLLRPWREKHVAKYWDAATVERMGRNWYYEIHPREFGFNYSGGFLQVYFGPQTGDSTTEKLWCKTMPWWQMRTVRETLYGLEGEIYQQWKNPRGLAGSDHFEAYRTARDQQPKRTFRFLDYDGQEINATVRIEESEHRRGSGAFKWVGWLMKARVARYARIEFSAEVGPEKGSWKGGTLGHGREISAGVLHGQAFALYCAENGLRLIDEVRT